MTVPQRYGMTVPVRRHPAASSSARSCEELADLGYTDMWSAESGGADAFTPLALAAAWAPSLRLGTAIVPGVHPRRAHARVDGRERVPGRAGPLRARHRHLVERDRRALERHAVRRAVPARARHVRFLRAALAGEKVTEDVRDVRGQGLPARHPVPEQPPILVAALREGMLRLAGREGDGAIINWLSADDVKTVVPHVGADKEIVGRIFVLPVDDAGHGARGRQARDRGVPQRAGVRRVPRVARPRRRAQPTCGGCWKEGDRKAAAASIPDHVVDELLVWGKPEQCREHIQRYIDNGVTTPAPALFCGPDQLALDALKRARTPLQPVRRHAAVLSFTSSWRTLREAAGTRACARPPAGVDLAPLRGRSAPRWARRGGCCAGPRRPVTSASSCPLVAELA